MAYVFETDDGLFLPNAKRELALDNARLRPIEWPFRAEQVRSAVKEMQEERIVLDDVISGMLSADFNGVIAIANGAVADVEGLKGAMRTTFDSWVSTH